MKFENTEVWGFEHAMRGMRNPKNSWSRGDTHEKRYLNALNGFSFHPENYQICRYEGNDAIFVEIGPNDMKLAQALIRGGSEHRKFMRQIFVSVDITAPLYWWKEFDTYKVGTVANSTSTMHKLAETPITIDCFEIDDYNPDISVSGQHEKCNMSAFIKYLIDKLEILRQKYLETKDLRYWKELIRWLPESWLQTRTVTMTYENLLAMCGRGQRRFHKLNEWSGINNPILTNFISWSRTLPYAQELIYLDELDQEKLEKLEEDRQQLKN